MKISESQQRALDNWWLNETEEYDYMDNERLATKGNIEQENIYDKQVGEGCCGSVDVELDCDDGTVLMFGFNYGH